jgi:hypothetical protein
MLHARWFGAPALVAGDRDRGEAGAHLCHAVEYLRTSSAVLIPASGAWLDPSADATNGEVTWAGPTHAGRWGSRNYTCANWNHGASGTWSGTYLAPDSSLLNDSSLAHGCGTQRALACCF